jgi:hypothetical protein
MNLIYLIPLITILILFSNTLNGQELKNEKEVRISSSDAPLSAQSTIDNYKVRKKVKWYKQTNFEHVSFEAKFRKQGDFYSVSFDTLGEVIDIEKLIKRKDLDHKEQEKIDTIFCRAFDKFKIIKCQIQFTSDTYNLNKFFENEIYKERADVNYEIEVEGKSNNWLKFEFLINSEGLILRKREIVDVSTENLNY